MNWREDWRNGADSNQTQQRRQNTDDLLTVGQCEGLHVELVAGSQTRFGEELVHGHDQVSLRHSAHSV